MSAAAPGSLPTSPALRVREMEERVWPTVLDMVEDWMREDQLDWGEVRERLGSRNWRDVLTKTDVAEVEGRMRARWRTRMEEEQRRESVMEDYAKEVPGGGVSAPVAGGRVSESGFLAMLGDAVASIFGRGVAEMRPVWRRGPSRVLHAGDDATVLHGPGTERGVEWLVCAVRVTRKDGEVEILAEHKIRSRGREVKSRYKGVLVHLLVLEMEAKAHEPEAMMRRLAAFKLAYFGDRSGMKDMVEAAALNGCSKQAMHQQLGVIRRQHQKRTGDKKVRIGGAVPARGRRKGRKSESEK